MLRLLKALYGLKQGGRAWYEMLDKTMRLLGFERVQSDRSVWVWLRDGVRLIVPAYVDDLTLVGADRAKINSVVAELQQHFKLRILGDTSFLLGVEIARDRINGTTTLSQRQYALDVLERFDMADCNGVLTPMEPGLKLSKSQSPSAPEEVAEMRNVPYLQAIGSLLYLAIATRPDISFAVGVLARFASNPGVAHWKAVKHLFRYLRSTVDYKLTYRRSAMPEAPADLFTAYSDADHGGNIDNGRSTSGYIIRMAGAAISWSSRLQPVVTLSTTEAEYVAAVRTAQEVLWLRSLFTEFGFDFSTPCTLLIDNASAVQVAKNPEHHGRMKHLDLKYFWLRDIVEQGDLRVQHLPGTENVADLFTKPLARPILQELVGGLGLGV